MALDPINKFYSLNDMARWRDQWFVIGYEIRLSNKQDMNCQICRHLQGIYPKEFTYLGGWHEGCRCIALPILEDEKTRDLMLDYLLGLKKEKPFVRYFSMIPTTAKRWIESNRQLVKHQEWYSLNIKFFS
ncbi:hypothetical protein [Flavihumibacter petaseus]|uniref:Phage head morphogenesis domain-containing protein n=1 Tax=Flavihumibacter petaseus NBRC 106054 TaxID=1220578 RepID=A0A0E9N146_9BACT|nr:hypothetical protein [Flavihumibacter petaseus]GAO43752.1 hypothetical protein FPE01S_02_08580 [Flavihumibacter petaseus NBRC 106054]